MWIGRLARGLSWPRIRHLTQTIITNAGTPAEFREARKLFEEYAEDVGLDLDFQNFARELEELARMYAPPVGCLLLASRLGLIAGCIGLRRFDREVCEMKRLYVQPSGRGQGVGRALVTAAIGRARQLGYRRMVLDTLASMKPARTLYRSLGFRETDPYYDNPIEDAVYMELNLG